MLRIEFEGALYHVSCRGNNGADIFFGDEGREKWLDTLDECCVRSGWVVHAYVLMGNHYHLLLETPEGNLVDGMKWLQGTYTQRINAWRKRRGHLFQGRYKAQLVNSEQRGGNYLQVASDYIHLNPARAGLVGDHGEWRKLADYPWSSLPLYLGWKRKRPEWLETGKVLGSLNLKDGTAGRESYGRYLEARVLEERAGREEAGKAYAESESVCPFMQNLKVSVPPPPAVGYGGHDSRVPSAPPCGSVRRMPCNPSLQRGDMAERSRAMNCSMQAREPTGLGLQA